MSPLVGMRIRRTSSPAKEAMPIVCHKKYIDNTTTIGISHMIYNQLKVSCTLCTSRDIKLTIIPTVVDLDDEVDNFSV